MGEGFGAYVMGRDRDLIGHVTSANIACGFHAGDPGWMRATVALAEAHGVGIGAHPGFPDLRGFGRRVIGATPAEIRDDLVYQIGALTAFTRAKRLQHVKPHGALYNLAVDHEDVAAAIADAVLAVDPELLVVVLAGSSWERTARGRGLRVAREVFADRAVDARGALVPRSAARRRHPRPVGRRRAEPPPRRRSPGDRDHGRGRSTSRPTPSACTATRRALSASPRPCGGPSTGAGVDVVPMARLAGAVAHAGAAPHPRGR